jgi:hypothetical protein
MLAKKAIVRIVDFIGLGFEVICFGEELFSDGNDVGADEGHDFAGAVHPAILASG